MITREFNPLLPILFGLAIALAASHAMAGPSLLQALPTYSQYDFLQRLGLVEIPLPATIAI